MPCRARKASTAGSASGACAPRWPSSKTRRRRWRAATSSTSPDPIAAELHAFDASEAQAAIRLHALLTLAHAQEARWLAAGSAAPPPPVTLEALRSRRQFCIGAFDGDELVGALCIAADDEPDQIQIATLVVHPGHQRLGIARRLMREALQRGTGLAYSVITGAANQPALALYQGLGFVPYRHGLLDGSGIALVKLRRDPGLPLD
jgi:ribosomal protein S18 acetylase RimI-like enzyme